MNPIIKPETRNSLMARSCIKNLDQLRALLKVIPRKAYNFRSNLLSGATIGQHIRHILECYTCLLNGVLSTGFSSTERDKRNITGDAEYQDSNPAGVPVVNYDKRPRDPEIETRPGKALETIDYICELLTSDHHWPVTIIVVGNYEPDPDCVSKISSTFERELLYNLTHSIHHQALIKVGLLEQHMDNLVDENFGVAPSTIQDRQISR